MPKADQTRVRDLRDLAGLPVSLIVDAPVSTSRTPGDSVLDDGDDVFVTLLLPGGVRADVVLTVAEYRAIAKGQANAHAAQATRPLALEG